MVNFPLTKLHSSKDYSSSLSLTLKIMNSIAHCSLSFHDMPYYTEVMQEEWFLEVFGQTGRAFLPRAKEGKKMHGLSKSRMAIVEMGGYYCKTWTWGMKSKMGQMEEPDRGGKSGKDEAETKATYGHDPQRCGSQILMWISHPVLLAAGRAEKANMKLNNPSLLLWESIWQKLPHLATSFIALRTYKPSKSSQKRLKTLYLQKSQRGWVMIMWYSNVWDLCHRSTQFIQFLSFNDSRCAVGNWWPTQCHFLSSLPVCLPPSVYGVCMCISTFDTDSIYSWLLCSLPHQPQWTMRDAEHIFLKKSCSKLAHFSLKQTEQLPMKKRE